MRRSAKLHDYSYRFLNIVKDREHPGTLLISHKEDDCDSAKILKALQKRIPKDVLHLEIVNVQTVKLSFINETNESAGEKEKRLREIIKKLLDIKFFFREWLMDTIRKEERERSISNEDFFNYRTDSLPSTSPQSISSDPENLTFFQVQEVKKRNAGEFEVAKELKIETEINLIKVLTQNLKYDVASLQDGINNLLDNLSQIDEVNTQMNEQLRILSIGLYELQSQQNKLSQENDNQMEIQLTTLLTQYVQNYEWVAERPITLEEVSDPFTKNLLREERNKILSEYSLSEGIINQKILELQIKSQACISAINNLKLKSENYRLHLNHLESELKQKQEAIEIYESDLKRLAEELNEEQNQPSKKRA